MTSAIRQTNTQIFFAHPRYPLFRAVRAEAPSPRERVWGPLLAISVAGLMHAWLAFGYLHRAVLQPDQPARPLPMLDIALLAPPSAKPAAALAPPAPPPPAKPRVEKPRPPVAVKKPKPPVEKKPVVAKPQRLVPETPPAPPVTDTATINQPAAMERSAASSSGGAVGGRGSASGQPAASHVAARFNAAYLNNTKPSYPTVARSRHWEGRVALRVYVLEDGSGSQVTLHQSSGYEILDQAALEAVRRWRFVPARRGDMAVASWVEVPIVFKLE